MTPSCDCHCERQRSNLSIFCFYLLTFYFVFQRGRGRNETCIAPEVSPTLRAVYLIRRRRRPGGLFRRLRNSRYILKYGPLYSYFFISSYTWLLNEIASLLSVARNDTRMGGVTRNDNGAACHCEAAGRNNLSHNREYKSFQFGFFS